jgi:hypothetical protein
MRLKTIAFALIGSLIAFSSCEKEDEDSEDIINVNVNGVEIDSRLIDNWIHFSRDEENVLIFSSSGEWSWVKNRLGWGNSSYRSGEYRTSGNDYLIFNEGVGTTDRTVRYTFYNQGDSLSIRGLDGGVIFDDYSGMYGRE